MRRKSGYAVEDYTELSNQGAGNLTHEKLTPLQAIRHYCWACQGGHEHPWVCGDGKTEKPLRPYDEVKACTTTTCYLFPFRTGRNPYAKRPGNVANLKGPK